MSTPLSITRAQVLVRSVTSDPTKGTLTFGDLQFPCALGRSGVTQSKREGDGATPAGTFKLLRVYYNPERLGCPRTRLPSKQIAPNDGWCDAPEDKNYNRPVQHPYPASAEHMWRDDALYDVVVVLDHNIRPRVRGGGSAIFMHVARPGFLPTEGCIALRRDDLLKLLEQLPRYCEIAIST